MDEKTVGAIGKGLMVLIGVGQEDTKEVADKYLKKLLQLRIFEDENGKTNRSLMDIGGSLLLISQFTLYANCRHGNRPSFTDAGNPRKAEELYEYLIAKAKEQVAVVEPDFHGIAFHAFRRKLIHHLAQRGLAAHSYFIRCKIDAQRVLQTIGNNQRSTFQRINKALAVDHDLGAALFGNHALIIQELALDQPV